MAEFSRIGWPCQDRVQRSRRSARPRRSGSDLVDGDEFASKLKELGLGIKRELVEAVHVDEGWFDNL